jgi:hypothetical protein
MANSFVTPQVMSETILAYLENNLVAGRLVHKGFSKDIVGKHVGSTIDIKKPILFQVSDGSTRQNQNVTEQTIPLVVNKRKHISFTLDQDDLTLSFDRFNEVINRSSAIPLANEIEKSILETYAACPSAAGVAATTPTSISTWGAASQKLDEQSALDNGQRVAIVNPAAKYGVANTLTGLNSAATVESALRRAQMGPIQGLSTFSTQIVQSHTAGTPGGTPLVNGASQTGANLIADGLTATTGDYHKGDIITLVGVYAVNAYTRQSTGALRQFTVTADATADGGGDITIPIYPSIITSGAYQTCSASPADGAAITLTATHIANLAFHPDAIALVMVPINPPLAANTSTASFNGYSLQVTIDYDNVEHATIVRVDAMWAVKMIYPELCTRILG